MEIKAGFTPPIGFFIGQTSTPTVGLTGVAASITVKVAIGTAALATGAGTIAERGGTGNGDGWYDYTPVVGETTSSVDQPFTILASVAGGVQHNAVHDLVVNTHAEMVATLLNVQAEQGNWGAVINSILAVLGSSPSTIAQQINDVAATAGSILADTAEIGDSGSTLVNDVSAVKAVVDAMDAKIGAPLVSVAADIGSVNTNVAAVQTVVDAINLEIGDSPTSITTQISNVQASVDGISGGGGGGAITLADKNSIADIVLRRSVGAAIASADGDAITGNAFSLLGLVMGVLNGDSSSGVQWVIRDTAGAQIAALPIDLFDSNKLISKVGG